MDTRETLLKIEEIVALWKAGFTTHESTLLNISEVLKGTGK